MGKKTFIPIYSDLDPENLKNFLKNKGIII